MAKDFSLADVKFRMAGHIALADEYITSYINGHRTKDIHEREHSS